MSFDEIYNLIDKSKFSLSAAIEQIYFNDDMEFLHDSRLRALSKEDFEFCVCATVQLLQDHELSIEQIKEYLHEEFSGEIELIDRHIVSIIGEWKGTVKHQCEYARQIDIYRQNRNQIILEKAA